MNTTDRDPCAGRHGGNAYSVEAWETRSKDAARKQREVIFQMIQAAGSNGLTLDEISERLGVAPNRISGRITELRHKQSRIVASGEKRTTRTGSSAAVYVIPSGQGSLF